MSDDHPLIDDTDASPALETRVIAVPVEPVRRAASSLGPTFTRYCLVGGSGSS